MMLGHFDPGYPVYDDEGVVEILPSCKHCSSINLQKHSVKKSTYRNLYWSMWETIDGKIGVLEELNYLYPQSPYIEADRGLTLYERELVTVKCRDCGRHTCLNSRGVARGRVYSRRAIMYVLSVYRAKCSCVETVRWLEESAGIQISAQTILDFATHYLTREERGKIKREARKRRKGRGKEEAERG